MGLEKALRDRGVAARGRDLLALGETAIAGRL